MSTVVYINVMHIGYIYIKQKFVLIFNGYEEATKNVKCNHV